VMDEPAPRDSADHDRSAHLHERIAELEAKLASRTQALESVLGELDSLRERVLSALDN
jgi:hypothetical protein